MSLFERSFASTEKTLKAVVLFQWPLNCGKPLPLIPRCEHTLIFRFPVNIIIISSMFPILRASVSELPTIQVGVCLLWVLSTKYEVQILKKNRPRDRASLASLSKGK